jgi:hypothetical protein
MRIHERAGAIRTDGSEGIRGLHVRNHRSLWSPLDSQIARSKTKMSVSPNTCSQFTHGELKYDSDFAILLRELFLDCIVFDYVHV